MDNSSARGDRAQLVEDDGLMHSPDDIGGHHDSTQMSQLHMDREQSSQSRSSKSNSEGLRRIVIACVCFAVCVTVALIMTIYLADPVLTPHGGVVSDNAVCSQLGLSILKRGGSAIDAAITTILCEGAVNPLQSGLGGGGFAVVRLGKKNITEVYDFMCASYEGATIPIKDDKVGLTVAVPGLLRGLKQLHDKYGRLKWKDIVQPVVSLTSQPINMSIDLVNEIKLLPAGSPLAKYFTEVKHSAAANSDDIPHLQQMKLTNLSGLLQRIAERGDRVLYEDAKQLIDTVNSASGNMSMEDLMNYRVNKQLPIRTSFLGTNIDTVGAPGGGPALLLILNILQNITSSSTSNVAWNSSDLPHILIEATKFSMPHLAILDDPVFNSTVQAIVDIIISQAYADEIAERIDMERTYSDKYYAVDLTRRGLEGSASAVLSRGTSHVSVIGTDEDMISITTTLNGPFGSRLVTHDGIILNNHMINFNQLQARTLKRGHRPVTTLSPVLIYNPVKSCARRLSLGATHGFAAIEGLVQVISDLIVQRKNLSESINTARLYQLPSGCVLYEKGVNQEVRNDLKRREHNECSTAIVNDPIPNIVHALLKVNQTVFGAADATRATQSMAAIF